MFSPQSHFEVTPLYIVVNPPSKEPEIIAMETEVLPLNLFFFFFSLSHLSRTQISCVSFAEPVETNSLTDAVSFIPRMYISLWQLGACLLQWDNRSGVHERTVTFVPTCSLFAIWTSEYDHASSFATLGPQDTDTVSRCFIVSPPPSDLAALGEVYPPPHPQCLYHPLLWGVLLPPGQFQAQALWPGFRGCVDTTHWAWEGRTSRQRAGHTRARGARWASTQVRVCPVKCAGLCDG